MEKLIERVTNFIFNGKMYEVSIKSDDKYHYLTTPFVLKDEAKVMRGARWQGHDPMKPEKVWRVDNCRRNNFSINYLEGKNPYLPYTKVLSKDFKLDNGLIIPSVRTDYKNIERVIYSHQREMTQFMLMRRQCEIAGEMGIGKSFSAILAMELSMVPGVWYVAPKSALASVKLECMKWKCRANIKFMTYDELKKVLTGWKEGYKPPQMVIFDEASKVKTPTSQRSQAAYYLAESMRDAYGDKAYIILMSGSPAPKSPLDYYWQCEIACPGFIREGDIHKFQYRLAVMAQQEDITGIKYNKLIAWKDGNPTICNTCGKAISEIEHVEQLHGGYHKFVPIANEIEKLYRRMSGLVYVKFKKDCLDLPDKNYRIIRLQPSLDLLRAARLISGQSRTAIQQLTLMRELSDGFQYRDTIKGNEVCEFCHGNKTIINSAKEPVACEMCNGTGSKNKIEREIIEVDSPKLGAVTDLLEELEDVGRVVIYAGFTASIDRVCKHVKNLGWEFIRVDGRGWYNSINQSWTDLQMLQAFQDSGWETVPGSKDGKIAFIGHPGSAGMGLTLTASPMIVYVSNDFNAESRIQSEDRIHRPGMDVNRGATIVDLFLLPTDEKVYDNLKRKRELQSISLGELQSSIDNYKFTNE